MCDVLAFGANDIPERRRDNRPHTIHVDRLLVSSDSASSNHPRAQRREYAAPIGKEVALMAAVNTYPVSLSVDYPDRPLDRLTTLLRIFTVIPIGVILGLLSGGGSGQAAAAGGLLTAPTLLMLVFRQKYPRWWFDWNVAFTSFSYRVTAYFLLLRDEYPSTDEEQAVHLVLPYPDARLELNRWLPLVKWLLAIPHYIVLAVLGLAVFVCVIFAWFSILFTARYPVALFDFVVGVLRWSLRVTAYAFILNTDIYPPFRLSE
jgi:hypothetical protein